MNIFVRVCDELSELRWLALCKQQSESFLALHSFLAELVIRTETSRMSIEGIRSVLQHNLKSIDPVSIGVEIIPQIHVVEYY